MFRYNVYSKPSETTPTEVTPADGSTVRELSVIEILFPGEDCVLVNTPDEMAYITDENGNKVCELSYDCMTENDDWDGVIITLPQPITAAGTYTLTIPDTFISFDWWERDCSELTFSWTVSSAVGILDINDDEAAGCVIYDLSGNRISLTDIRTLPAGIYVVNGRKIMK